MRENGAAERTHQIKMSKGRRPWIPRQLLDLTAFDWLRRGRAGGKKTRQKSNLASREGASAIGRELPPREAPPHVPRAR